MRVAIVHDWLRSYDGPEEILEQLLAVFEEADVFTLADFLPASQRQFLDDRCVRTSLLQQMPLARRCLRMYLPMMPLAVEQFDLGGYDLVISNSRAVAKGVITGPDQLHLCLCLSAMRYAWDRQHEVLRGVRSFSGLRAAYVRLLLHRQRLWDVRTANGVDQFLALSHFTARAIRKTYRRDAQVLWAPVDIETFSPGGQKDSFYLAVGGASGGERMDLIAEAFAQMPDRPLVIIGEAACTRQAAQAGPNVSRLGRVEQPVLIDHLRRARALVVAGEDELGLAAVKAQACGTPVIALGRGAVKETVLDGRTGRLFEEQTVAGIVDAVRRFEQLPEPLDPAACRANAERFSHRRFRHELARIVDLAYTQFRQGGRLDEADRRAEVPDIFT